MLVQHSFSIHFIKTLKWRAFRAFRTMRPLLRNRQLPVRSHTTEQPNCLQSSLHDCVHPQTWSMTTEPSDEQVCISSLPLFARRVGNIPRSKWQSLHRCRRWSIVRRPPEDQIWALSNRFRCVIALGIVGRAYTELVVSFDRHWNYRGALLRGKELCKQRRSKKPAKPILAGNERLLWESLHCWELLGKFGLNHMGDVQERNGPHQHWVQLLLGYRGCTFLILISDETASLLNVILDHISFGWIYNFSVFPCFLPFNYSVQSAP